MSADRILVVEDDSSLRELLCRSIEREGFETISAADGQEAFERFQETCGSPVDREGAPDPRSIHAVVTDFLMPRMDGATLARKIKDINPDFPMIFVTGEAPDSVVLELASYSRCIVLIKPFRPEALRDGLARVLQKPLQEAQLVRRKSIRTEVLIPCALQSLETPDTPAVEARATVRNLSFGGCLLKLEQQIDVGQSFRLLLSGLERFPVLAQVAWADREAQLLGVRSTPETPEILHFLNRFVLQKLKQKGVGIMGVQTVVFGSA